MSNYYPEVYQIIKNSLQSKDYKVLVEESHDPWSLDMRIEVPKLKRPLVIDTSCYFGESIAFDDFEIDLSCFYEKSWFWGSRLYFSCSKMFNELDRVTILDIFRKEYNKKKIILKQEIMDRQRATDARVAEQIKKDMQNR